MKYGLQLYSIRDITQNDLASAIKKTAELGYNCVEFAGFFGHTANEINSMLENNYKATEENLQNVPSLQKLPKSFK